jgi:hypothetical protein
MTTATVFPVFGMGGVAPPLWFAIIPLTGEPRIPSPSTGEGEGGGGFG